MAAIEQGYVQREIEDAAFEYASSIETSTREIVGVNAYTEDEVEEVPLHRLEPEIERRQVERTQTVRADRDTEAAKAALWAVRECARGEGNLLLPMRSALAARCTIGEICEVMREEFGTYDANLAA